MRRRAVRHGAWRRRSARWPARRPRCPRSAPVWARDGTGLIERLLAADPGDRPASARVVLRELTRLGGGAAGGRRRSGSSASRTAIRWRVCSWGAVPSERSCGAGRWPKSLSEGTPPQAASGAGGRARLGAANAVRRGSARRGGGRRRAGAAGVEIWRGDFAGFERWMAPAKIGGRGGPAPRARAPAGPPGARAGRTRLRRARCASIWTRRSGRHLRPFHGRRAAGGAALVVVACVRPLESPDAASVELAPLGADDVAALVAGRAGAAPAASRSRRRHRDGVGRQCGGRRGAGPAVDRQRARPDRRCRCR